MMFVDDMDGRVRIAFSAPTGDLIAIVYISPDEAADIADELRRMAEQILRNRGDHRAPSVVVELAHEDLERLRR